MFHFYTPWKLQKTCVNVLKCVNLNTVSGHQKRSRKNEQVKKIENTKKNIEV